MKILSQLIYVEPDRKAGFNFGYFIKVSSKGESKKVQLIGECNNCGIVNTSEEAISKTLWEIEYNWLVCKELQTKIDVSAIIIPCFIRPMSGDGKNNIYTHMLTSQALKTEIENIKRIDKQYLNMIKNAKNVLKNLGYETSDKIIMTGFSASSKFALRFALLYPEMVSSVIAGGMSALLCLPIEEIDGEILNYPLGVKDYQELIGKSFNIEDYKNVKQYLFMGNLDKNDPLKYEDCITKEERRIIHKIYDEDIQKRWIKMVDMIKRLNLYNIHSFLIKGVGHSPEGMSEIIGEHINEIINTVEK